MDHEVHVNQTIDRNNHSQCASIEAIIAEQRDIRKVVEDLASRLDRSQDTSSTHNSGGALGCMCDLHAAAVYPGQHNACCVAAEFIHGVLHHLMTNSDEAHPILCRFCVQSSRKWCFFSASQCVDKAWFCDLWVC